MANSAGKIFQKYRRCWFSVSCIVRFSNISWMSSPPPFLFPQGRGKFQYLSEKNTLPCLGHCKFFVVFFYLQLTLCTHMEKNFSRTRYPFYFSQTFTKYIRESSFKSLGDPFAHRQLHSPQFVMLCGGSSCYFWVLVWSDVINYLQLILTQPLVRRKHWTLPGDGFRSD